MLFYFVHNLIYLSWRINKTKRHMFLLPKSKTFIGILFLDEVLFRLFILLKMCFAEMSLVTHLHLGIESDCGYNLIRSKFSESWYHLHFSWQFVEISQFSFLYMSDFKSLTKWNYLVDEQYIILLIVYWLSLIALILYILLQLINSS